MSSWSRLGEAGSAHTDIEINGWVRTSLTHCRTPIGKCGLLCLILRWMPLTCCICLRVRRMIGSRLHDCLLWSTIAVACRLCVDRLSRPLSLWLDRVSTFRRKSLRWTACTLLLTIIGSIRLPVTRLKNLVSWRIIGGSLYLLRVRCCLLSSRHVALSRLRSSTMTCDDLSEQYDARLDQGQLTALRPSLDLMK